MAIAHTYRIASYLEKQLEWNPDAELVEILDMTAHAAQKAHSEAVQAWEQRHSIVSY